MRFVVLFRCFLVAALVGAGLGFGATPAQAYPICAGAEASGVAGSYEVEKCVPYSGATLCHWQRVTAGWVLVVKVSACHPW